MKPGKHQRIKQTKMPRFMLEGLSMNYVINTSLLLTHQSIPAVPMPSPPGQPPGISICLGKMGKFPGVGTHELSKCPGVGTKKEGKCPAPEIVAFEHFCSFCINRRIRSALKPTSKPFNNEKVRRL